MTNLQEAFDPKKQELADEEMMLPMNVSHCPPAMKKRATHIINTIAKHSPIGKELIENAIKEGYELMMFSACGWSGQVLKQDKLLFLNASCTDDSLVETMAHECRHIQQFTRGVEEGCSSYALKESVMVHRAKEADAETTAAAVCHEIKVNGGIDSPWNEYEKERPDIALGFKNAAKEENSPVTQEMLRGGFDGWFKNTRIVDLYEENYIRNGTLNECWNRDVDPKDFFHKQETSAEIVAKVCTDKQGNCYWANNPDVLNEPDRLTIHQSTIDKADTTFKSREDMGFTTSYDYRSMPTYEGAKEAAKQQEKQAKKVKPAVLAKIASARGR